VVAFLDGAMVTEREVSVFAKKRDLVRIREAEWAPGLLTVVSQYQPCW
jgi:hypothetical protein